MTSKKERQLNTGANIKNYRKGKEEKLQARKKDKERESDREEKKIEIKVECQGQQTRTYSRRDRNRENERESVCLYELMQVRDRTYFFSIKRHDIDYREISIEREKQREREKLVPVCMTLCLKEYVPA